jgi:hypothetical protein
MAQEVWVIVSDDDRARLEAIVGGYLAEHNQVSRPFSWTRSADTILDQLATIPVPSV